jgi:hypothetical protein
MKKPFIAIFTETPNSGNSGSDAVTAVTAALLVVFANRDAQTLDDVEGTKVNLEGQGEGVHIREFDFLREIPDLWDLSPSPAGVGEGARRADEGSGENPIISAEADKIIAERLAESPNNPAIQPSINPEAVGAIHRCLRLLAGTCDGARRIDGAGFNKMDAEFGHSLANAHALSPKQAVHGQKLIRKYHRQLPADLLQAALGSTGDSPVPVGDPPTDIPSAPANLAPGIATPVVPNIGPDAVSVRTPAQLINHKYTKLVKPGVYQPKSGDEVARNGCKEYYGDTYQNGVKPGPKKLAQFREILELTDTPKLYAQDGKGDEALVHVKLFDPTGSWTWFITEFGPAENTAFGLVNGHEAEVGYIDLNELANVSGRMGIGIEIDMQFKPQTLAACRAALAARAN